jgi:hypothetical protein
MDPAFGTPSLVIESDQLDREQLQSASHKAVIRRAPDVIPGSTPAQEFHLFPLSTSSPPNTPTSNARSLHQHGRTNATSQHDSTRGRSGDGVTRIRRSERERSIGRPHNAVSSSESGLRGRAAVSIQHQLDAALRASGDMSGRCTDIQLTTAKVEIARRVSRSGPRTNVRSTLERLHMLGATIEHGADIRALENFATEGNSDLRRAGLRRRISDVETQLNGLLVRDAVQNASNPEAALMEAMGRMALTRRSVDDVLLAGLSSEIDARSADREVSHGDQPAQPEGPAAAGDTNGLDPQASQREASEVAQSGEASDAAHPAQSYSNVRITRTEDVPAAIAALLLSTCESDRRCGEDLAAFRFTQAEAYRIQEYADDNLAGAARSVVGTVLATLLRGANEHENPQQDDHPPQPSVQPPPHVALTQHGPVETSSWRPVYANPLPATSASAHGSGLALERFDGPVHLGHTVSLQQITNRGPSEPHGIRRSNRSVAAIVPSAYELIRTARIREGHSSSETIRVRNRRRGSRQYVQHAEATDESWRLPQR